jgi:hypothetical protein
LWFGLKFFAGGLVVGGKCSPYSLFHNFPFGSLFFLCEIFFCFCEKFTEKFLQ